MVATSQGTTGLKQSEIISDATPFAGASIASIKTAIDQLAGQNALISVHQNITVAASGGTITTITPPAGQKWQIYVSAWLNEVGSDNVYVGLNVRDAGGVYYEKIASLPILSSVKFLGVTSIFGKLEITDIKYLEIIHYKSGVGTTPGGYGYFGVRLV